MPKFTEEEKDNLQEKLEYLGLNLEEVPEELKEFRPLEYRTSKMYDEKVYKEYRYITVDRIEILLTPKNRLDSLQEKYEKASPLASYLNPQKEEDIPKTAVLLQMISKVNREAIEKIEEEQNLLNKGIPFKVKYPANYLWQIYYSEFTDQYFMLVPMEDQEYASFFYVLKKQLEYIKEKQKTKTVKPASIFVPICHAEYSGEYLKPSEMADIENYLWLFTKDWPLVYEVYDKEENLSIRIVGDTICYAKMKSIYNITLSSKEEAIHFYKLLKALFILQTELKNEYYFEPKIDKKGGLEFYLKNKNVSYEDLPEFTKMECMTVNESVKKQAEEMTKLEDQVKDLKQKSSSLDSEYLNLERQIATYLECKKSFFGKLKYFFKNKKEKKKTFTKVSENTDLEKTPVNNLKEKYIGIKHIDNGHYGLPEKEFYTIEDLLKVSKALEENKNHISNLRLDVTALRNKIESMKLKVRNASLYMEEIDNHKKSIFEFWKFANKDENLGLAEGRNEENEKDEEKHLEKVFDLEEDFEEIGKQLDKRQREVLNTKEQDSIYLLTTEVFPIIQELVKKEEMKDEQMEIWTKEILEKAKKEKELFAKEEFDIFGNIAEDKTKIKTIANKKHREIKKDAIKILDITKHTTPEEYKKTLEEVILKIEEAMKRITVPMSIDIYQLVKKEDEISKGLEEFHIKPEEALKEEWLEEETTAKLYKFHIPKERNQIAFATNIIYYYNNNNTLPVGMDITDKVYLNLEHLEWKKEDKKDFRITIPEKEYAELSTRKVKHIWVEEYNIVKKEQKVEDEKND